MDAELGRNFNVSRYVPLQKLVVAPAAKFRGNTVCPVCVLIHSVVKTCTCPEAAFK